MVAGQRDDMRVFLGELHDELQDLGTVRAAVDVVAEEDEQIVILILYLGPEREQAVPVAMDVADGQQTAEPFWGWYEDESVIVLNTAVLYVFLLLPDFF